MGSLACVWKHTSRANIGVYLFTVCVEIPSSFVGNIQGSFARVWEHTSRANIGVYVIAVCVEITSSSLGNIGLFCVCVEAHEPCKYWGISLHRVCGNNELFSGKYRALLRVCGSTRAMQILGYISPPSPVYGCRFHGSKCRVYGLRHRVQAASLRANSPVSGFMV